MPEVNSHDWIIGLSDQKPCEDKEGGVADSQGGRYAEIFVNSPKGDKSNRAQYLGEIGAHEALHLFGLGHAGKVSGKNPDGSYSDLLLLPSDRKSTPFDLQQYFTKSRYVEYGDDTNIMGSYINYPPQIPPKSNPIQQDALRWPQAEINGNHVLGAREAGHEWTRINYQDATNGEYGIVRLEEPLKLSDSGEQGYEKTFDTLAFLPQVDESGKIDGAKLVLTDSANAKGTTVEVGSIYSSNQSWRLQYGSQIIEFRGDNTLELRVSQN